jgi:subfamily B ATP-binding cassette protein MsbA
MKRISQLLHYLKPYGSNAIMNVVFNIFSILFSLASFAMLIPFLRILFDEKNDAASYPNPGAITMSVANWIEQYNFFLSRIIADHGKITALSVVCISVVIVFFFKNFFRWLAIYFLAPIRNGISRDVRNDLYDKVLQLPLSYYSNERKGDIIARITSDVQEVEYSIFSMLESMIKDPIEMISYIAVMIFYSPKLTLMAFIVLPISGLVIALVGKSLKRWGKKGFGKYGELVSMIEETLGGIKIIKGFNAEGYVKKHFHNNNQEMFELNNKIIRLRDLSSPMSEFLGISAVMMVLYLGGSMVLQHKMDLAPETFITFILIFSQLINPAKSFSNSFFNIQKGMAAAERINYVLHAENKITDASNPTVFNSFSQSVEYRNVSFAYNNYDDAKVLNNINVKIEKGKMFALVGPSGSGKTTMADLLPRFWDVPEGEILIDGINIKNMSLHDLRKQIGIVSQEAILFNDTVFNNIAFGIENISEADVINAAKVANAHEFIEKMENGYQTNIGDRGSKLSGGQRQRLTIARAVLKNPPILILDEATSALDTESEKLVQEALFKLMQNRTSIVIAHRLSTIQSADEILVMQKGNIVERGNHQHLMTLENGVYKKLVDLQAF